MKNKIFKELVQVVSNNKKIIFIVLSIIVILLIIIFGIILFLNINYINKYKNYEDKMITYGFDKLYNNEKANTTNFVKNSEAIKVIICASYNISNLQKFNIYSDEDKYLNSSYIEYAKICKILNDEINDKNYNKKISRIDAINYLSKAKKYILLKDLNINQEIKFKDKEKYNPDQIIALKDFVYNKLIEDSKNDFKGKNKIKKGELNKLIIDYVEKYLVISNGEKVNINKEKLPTNYNDYPYTLVDINKKVYEYPYKELDKKNSCSANKEYSLKKEYYNQIKEFGENYMDAILNVDYTKIDKNIFKENLNLYLGNKLEDDVLNKYIEYVKSNKIIIKGKAKAQMPCIYYDGIFYRLRMNIEYKIISANKKENILLFDFDEDTKIQYEKLTNSMYIDLPYTVSPFLDIVYVDNQCINQLIVSGDNL